MKRITQIILVGHTKQRLIEAIKQFPLGKIILVLGDNPQLEGEALVVETANAVEEVFSGLISIERITVKKEDVLSAAIKILEVIMTEIRAGLDIQINISGSLRQMAIACYIAALVSKTQIYSVIPEYNPQYEEVGISRVHYIPLFPIKKLSPIKLQILQTLAKEAVVGSINELITKIYSNPPDNSNNTLRAKTSYYLKELEKDGFILKERLGKSVNIKMTQIGNIYSLGQEIVELKRKSL